MTHRSSMIRRCGIAAALVSLASLTACEQPKWDDPKYISQQLEKKDPNMRKVALGKFEALKDDQKKAVVPVLTKVYLEKDPNQKAVMKVLVKLRDPAAKAAYMEEVKTNATDYAAAAAEALGDSKAKEAIPDMIAALEKTDNDTLKQGLLRGLQQMPDPKMVPALTKILMLDADNNPIALHAYGCEIMGEVAQATPQALTPDAIKALTRGIFLANKMRQNVSTQCGLAVQQLGQPAVGSLVKLFKGERKDVQDLMMVYKFPPNQPKGVAATRLTKLLAQKEAGPLFIEAVSKKQEIPKSVSKSDHIAWVQMQIQLMQEMILGLGDLRTKEAKDLLISVLKGDKNKDMEIILDYTSETLLRQNAALALNAIGDRSAAPALLEAAKTGVIKDLEKLAKLQEKKGQAMPGLQRYSFNVTSARMYALLAGEGMEAGLKSLIATNKDKAVQKYYNSLMVMAKTFNECNKGDDKAKAACYAAKLKDKNTLVREKAAYELGRLSSAAAAPVLAQSISIQNLDTREVLTQQLYYHPSKAALASAQSVLKKEGTRRDAASKQDRFRLKMLIAWLKNNAK